MRMPPKLRQLRAVVAQAGFRRRSEKGSHQVWEHQLLPQERLVLSGNDGDDGEDGDDAQPYQEREVAKVLGTLAEAQRDEP